MKLFGKGGGPLTPAQKKLATAVAAMALIVAASVSADLALSRLDAERAEEATAEEVQPGPALDEKSSDPSDTEGASGAEAGGEGTSGAEAGADEEPLGVGAVYEGDGVSVENRAGRDLDATGARDRRRREERLRGERVRRQRPCVLGHLRGRGRGLLHRLRRGGRELPAPHAAGGGRLLGHAVRRRGLLQRQLEADGGTKNEGAEGGAEAQESSAQSDPADAAEGGAAS